MPVFESKAQKARKLVELGEISLRYAYFLLDRQRRASPELSAKLERKTGIPALAWLYPDEYPNPYLDRQKIHDEQISIEG